MNLDSHKNQKNLISCFFFVYMLFYEGYRFIFNQYSVYLGIFGRKQVLQLFFCEEGELNGKSK